MSLSTTSKWFLNTFRDSDSTTSLGSLFQCLTTLSVKKLFLISNHILQMKLKRWAKKREWIGRRNFYTFTCIKNSNYSLLDRDISYFLC